MCKGELKKKRGMPHQREGSDIIAHTDERAHLHAQDFEQSAGITANRTRYRLGNVWVVWKGQIESFKASYEWQV
jgi:hypothetical protein